MENTVQEKEQKKIQPKLILTIVGNVLFYSVIILLFLFSLMNINAGDGKKSFPNLFGRGMLTVASTSMERKEGGYTPAAWENYEIGEIKKDDLVKVKVFKGDLSTLKVGMVITFIDELNLAGQDTYLNTHRIVYIGETFVVCQGDYVITSYRDNKKEFDATKEDPVKENSALIDSGDAQFVETDKILGVVTGVSRGAGKVLTNIRQNWLFYFVIPVALVLVVEIFFVFKNILDLRNEKNKASLATDKEAMAAQIEADKAAMMAEIEAEKERMRQELLAELKAQQAAMNQQPAAEEKPTEEPKAEETTPQEETEEKAE